MGLREDILNEPVSDLGMRELLILKADDTVLDAVKLMRKKRLGCVLVVDGQGKPLGEFTEHTLLQLIGGGSQAMSKKLRDVASQEWISVLNTDPIAKVLDAMQDHGRRFVIVVDSQGKAIGLTGQRGMMEYIADHFPRQVKVHMIDDAKLYMDQREGA
ncbi:MAG: CBS domain-containing protein [Phycisphaeraceae bacterium]|nr:CBS domain-containing protein [Phycisphaeraceae bacterium]